MTQKQGSRSPSQSNQRAEQKIGALASTVLVLILAIVVGVFVEGWPSFSHNGLAWFGGGGNVDQQLTKIFESPAKPHDYVYTVHAFPLLWATALITIVSVAAALVLSVLSAMFIVEFAPIQMRRVLEPVVRLLAAVPSVVYGLIGILVLVPFVGSNLIDQPTKHSVENVVQLNGAGILVAWVILTVMIAPIMIAIVTDALRAVPSAWTEGGLALGVNRFRVLVTITLRTARPAIVAAAVLASARALGEAIMLSMVSGSVGFAPNPLDGLTFFLEPARPLAATIVDNAEGLNVPPFSHTIYAFAAVLLVSSMFLSFAGWVARRPLRRFAAYT
ncbi:MAG: phosphate ABC transporter permease subunit PstC [Thermoleophilaceae bacterium]